MDLHTSHLSRFVSRHAALALLLGLTGSLAVVASACGSDDDDANSAAGTPGGAGGNGDGGSLFPTGSGTGGSGSGTGGSTGTGFEECATASDEATLVPLNMILMFDRSSSMYEENKWNDATGALSAFLKDPESAGLRVALRFFPADSCNESSCDIEACSQPAVESAALTSASAPTDAQESALLSAIHNEIPNGDATPMYPALGGAERWAMEYVAAHPTEKAVVILVTDGNPNGCEQATDAIASLAEDAFTQSGVYTYAVGLAGSAEDLMNTIAARGGTTEGIFIGSGTDAQEDLLLALKAIQGSQLSCEFPMPDSSNGQEIDPHKVNVTYTPGGGGPGSTIRQVHSAAQCTTGGWYYDNAANPSKITLCPQTCHVVQSEGQGKIEIVIGCATETAE